MELLGQKIQHGLAATGGTVYVSTRSLNHKHAQRQIQMQPILPASVFPQKTREKKASVPCVRARARASNGDERMGQAGGPHGHLLLRLVAVASPSFKLPICPGILITSRPGSVRSHTILIPHHGTTSSARQHRSHRLPSSHHWTVCVCVCV
jgi:hypothetical protein